MTLRRLHDGGMTVDANNLRYEAKLASVDISENRDGLSQITAVGLIDVVSAIEDGEVVTTSTDGDTWTCTNGIDEVKAELADTTTDWTARFTINTDTKYVGEWVGPPYRPIVGEPGPEIFIMNYKQIYPNVGGHLEQENPAKETKMKALYRFYVVNRRTDVFLSKEFVGNSNSSVALTTVLLENADEIKLTVGAPEECEFELESVLRYEPIESESD